MPRTTADTGIIEIMDVNLRQGFAQVPRPVLRAKGLSVKAKLVYIALLDYAWQQGSCYPGQVRLAADLDVSVDTVQRALRELKRFQLVDWKQRGLNQTNVYQLLPLAKNPLLFPDDAGNRNLRLPETAGLRFQETATSGSKNTQEKKYADESLSNFERSHDAHFSEAGDSRPQAEVAPEGQETAPDASESAHRPNTPVGVVSRPTGPENAENAPLPEHSASQEFMAAHDAIRSTLDTRMSMDGEARRRSYRSESSASTPSPQPVPSAVSAAAVVPPAPRRRGRPIIGTSDERDLVYAYLDDFNRELLHDDAPLASLVTQTINIFRASNIPMDRWPDYLYQARTAVKEHAGAITKESHRNGSFKNRGPYYFAVLRNLVNPAESRQSPGAGPAP
jgi:hypothetical protein